jgi:hypothetical protein
VQEAQKAVSSIKKSHLDEIRALVLLSYTFQEPYQSYFHVLPLSRGV